MRGLWPIAVVGFFGVLLGGCDFLARYTTYRDQSHAPWDHGSKSAGGSVQDGLANCLPSGVKMETIVEVRPDGAKVTVESRLLELRAHAGGDGKLYDGNGREIRFYLHTARPTPAEANEVAVLRQQLLTVIELSTS